MGAKEFRAFAKNIPIIGDIIKSYEEEDDREYQRNLNQLQMDREDTNYQRTVNDMNMAGLSPLSMGSTNTSTAGTTTTHDTDSATDRLNNTLATISNIAKTTQEIKGIKATTENTNLENALLKGDKDYLNKQYNGSRIKYEVDTDPTKKLMNAIDNLITGLAKNKDSGIDILPHDNPNESTLNTTGTYKDDKGNEVEYTYAYMQDMAKKKLDTSQKANNFRATYEKVLSDHGIKFNKDGTLNTKNLTKEQINLIAKLLDDFNPYKNKF